MYAPIARLPAKMPSKLYYAMQDNFARTNPSVQAATPIKIFVSFRAFSLLKNIFQASVQAFTYR
jgi:hypothetical protein